MGEEVKLPGTPYKTEDIESGNILYVSDKPDARYRWSAGIALSRFLNELKHGRIIGIKCSRCDRIYVPPRVFCSYCFHPTNKWVYVKDTGIVNTAVISYIAADRGTLGEPMIVAVIELDGASPGMGILHKLGNVDPEDVKSRKIFGKRVKAVWKDESERIGDITDILYFEPIE
jgi:hypothetical protein